MLECDTFGFFPAVNGKPILRAVTICVNGGLGQLKLGGSGVVLVDSNAGDLHCNKYETNEIWICDFGTDSCRVRVGTKD